MDAPENFYKFMLSVRGARKRAALKGWNCALSDADALVLWRRCGGRCELTGIEFDFEAAGGKHQRRPYAPSIDRRDNSLGYVPGNVRVVCVAVNIAMNQWGEDVLHRLAVSLFLKGSAQRSAIKADHPTMLPDDVRLCRGKKRVTYGARVRDFGKEIHLGTFRTAGEAIDARKAWGIENKSLKVLRQVYDFTKDAELLTEMAALEGAQADAGRESNPSRCVFVRAA